MKRDGHKQGTKTEISITRNEIMCWRLNETENRNLYRKGFMEVGHRPVGRYYRVQGRRARPAIKAD